MKTVYRILSVLIIIICIIGILVSLAAIGLAWAYNTPVTQTLTDLMTQVQQTLITMTNLLNRTTQVTTQVLGLLSEVNQRVEDIQTNIAGSQPVIAILSALVGENISPKVDQAWETLVAIRTSAAALNTSIQTLNAMPFVSIPKIAQGTQEIENLFNDIINAVNDLEQFIGDLKSGANNALVLPVLDTLSELDRLLSAVQTELQMYNNQLITIESVVSELIPRIPRIIDTISLSISLVFAWLILAQTGLVYLSIVLFRTGSLTFARSETIDLEPRNTVQAEEKAPQDRDELPSGDEVLIDEVESENVEES